MNNARFAAGLCLLSFVLAACGRASNDINEDYGVEQLSPCSLKDSPFASLDFDDWQSTYHTTVRDVIAADQKPAQPQECTDSKSSLPPPTQELKTLAQSLPPWQSVARQNTLSEADMGAVLLEYLRTYECAMLDYRTFFYNNAMTGATRTVTTGPASGMTLPPETMGEYNDLRNNRDAVITSELTVARAALQRTLGIIGRMDRLRPAFADVNCFLTASLDLRNELGMAAEVSACLPRVYDARTSLRDLKPL